MRAARLPSFDDETSIAEPLADHLAKEGFDATVAAREPLVESTDVASEREGSAPPL